MVSLPGKSLPTADLWLSGESNPAFELDRTRPLGRIESGPLDSGGVSQRRYGVAEHFSRFGERMGGKGETPLDRRGIKISRPQIDNDNARHNLRYRAKRPRRDIEKNPSLTPGRPLQRQEAVPAAPWNGHHPVRNLALQHHHQAGEKVVARKESTKNGRPHRVRQVRGHLPWRFGSRQHIEVLTKGIGIPDLKAAADESLFQLRYQVFVELESQHSLESLEKGFSQSSSTGADLHYSRGLLGQGSDDAFGDIAIDEEILAEPVTLATTHQRNFEF